jgi:hypothetical protein
MRENHEKNEVTSSHDINQKTKIIKIRRTKQCKINTKTHAKGYTKQKKRNLINVVLY